MEKKLHMGSPVKLALALNYAVFQSEYLLNHAEAIKIAETAISDSTDKIEEFSEEEFKESKAIIDNLKNNIY